MDKAVAIKYQAGLPAPFVISKGRGELARRLAAIARSNGVEVVSLPQLADSLITIETGEWIPEEYFEVLAEVLAFVYRLKTKR